VIDRVNVVFVYDLLDGLPPGHVNELERPGFAQRFAGLRFVAGSDDVVVAVSSAKGQGQLRADLTAGPGHENLGHVAFGHCKPPRFLSFEKIPIRGGDDNGPGTARG